jgi:hypothetical protein
MNNIKFISFVVVALLLSTITSCSSSLLDIDQKGVESEASFYKTDNDIEEATAAVYRCWANTYSGKGSGSNFYCNGFFLKNMMGDDVDPGGARSDQVNAQGLFESTTTTSNGWVQTYYKGLFNVIYLANLVISKTDPSESDIKARDVAESKFFRALSYFELTTLWGTPPLVDHVLEQSEYEMSNSSTSELWAFIEKDLTDALSSGKLTTKSSVDDKDNSIRVTTEAAESLLGKAYLYEKKYADAHTQFQKVIDSQKYGLIDDISGLYHTACNSCKEYVFEVNRHYDTSNQYSQNGWAGILANWAFSYGLVKGPETTLYYQFNPIGYSYFNPSKSLYDAFIKEEGENGYRLRNTICTWKQLIAMNVYASSSRNFYGNEGFFRLKWLASRGDEDVNMWTGNLTDTPIIRYSDVLLMAAEAYLNDNNQTLADKYFNEVRTRAKLSSKTKITMADIKLERELEFALEGLRYQDLVRWGDAPTTLADKGKKLPTFKIIPSSSNDYSTAAGVYKAQYSTEVTYLDNENNLAGWTVNRDEYLPFPQSEVEVNTKLKQNNGY